MLDKEQIRKVLFEITKDCHCKDCFDPYCTLIEILLATGKDVRFLIQMKCVEKYRYEISRELDHPVDWNEAYQRWIDEGYAKKFADEYKEGISFEEIYVHVRPKKQ